MRVGNGVVGLLARETALLAAPSFRWRGGAAQRVSGIFVREIHRLQRAGEQTRGDVKQDAELSLAIRGSRQPLGW